LKSFLEDKVIDGTRRIDVAEDVALADGEAVSPKARPIYAPQLPYTSLEKPPRK
jgi:hypothetical protein